MQIVEILKIYVLIWVNFKVTKSFTWERGPKAEPLKLDKKRKKKWLGRYLVNFVDDDGDSISKVNFISSSSITVVVSSGVSWAITFLSLIMSSFLYIEF